MPTYKQEAFISRAIESLLGQDLSDWELIIIDDGSPMGRRSIQPFRPTVAALRAVTGEYGHGGRPNAMERQGGMFRICLDDVCFTSLARRRRSTRILMLSGLPHVRHHYNRPAPGRFRILQRSR
jgi:hypothetical protein